ncbi:MAG: ABC transporter substrate-binding protein [Candidatus Lokiarchaeota archaeon]|nr:ABC transporter substrate-binding protein [Candidatus Lokiarchaeota archaeon]
MDQIHRRKKGKKMTYFLLFIIGFSIGIPFGLLLSNQNLNVVTLDMIYSSEKRAWIENIALEFKQWYKNETGQDIQLNFRAMGSRSMMVSVETGEIQPTILSPASSIWIPFLNSRWTLGDIINTSKVITPVYSPIVIGTWSSFNNSVGGINNFDDLKKIKATVPDFHWAHTDPQLSNSGFMGVIMQVASFFNKNTSDLVFSDLTNSSLHQWMKILESSILFYGTSTGFLAKKAISGDLNAFLVYENLIIEINKEITTDTAVAIYPGNGTLLSDHPFAILDAPWVTAQERAAAEKFFEFLQLNSTIAKAFNDGFRPTDTSILSNSTYNNTFNSIFNAENGVKYSIPTPIYNPQINSQVLEYIPDLWIITRAG